MKVNLIGLFTFSCSISPVRLSEELVVLSSFPGLFFLFVCAACLLKVVLMYPLVSQCLFVFRVKMSI